MTQHRVRDPEQQRVLARRATVALGIAFAAFALLAGRLAILQLQRGDEYALKSRSNFIKELTIASDRGMILDRRGKILVDNHPAFDVAITPAFCKDLDEVLGRLAAYLTLGPEDIDRVRNQFKSIRGLARFKPFVVKSDITRDQLDRVEANLAELPGVDILSKIRRNYRMGAMAAHLLGYLSEIKPDELKEARAAGQDYQRGDYIGRRGLERRWESVLRGKDGIERVVADAKGRRVPEEDAQNLIPEHERITPSVPGHNLVLSLDARLQEAIEKAFPGKAGAVIAMDPRTGFILAMHSTPAPDSTRMSGRLTQKELDALNNDPLQPMIHRAIQEHYSPGSTFKVITAIAALAEGVTTPSRPVACSGSYFFGGRRWRCHKESGHGWMDLHGALKYSCDVYFYTMAERLGLEKLHKWATLFGVGQKTGIELSPEIPGFFPSVEWYEKRPQEGSPRAGAINAAIGQGAVDMTPLQLAVVYSALANGGRIFRPQVVRRIETAEGKVVRELGPVEVRTLPIRPQDLAAVKEALVAVVQEPGGTAHGSRLPDVVVAGKTGTAQVVKIGEVREKNLDYWQNDHAWFAAMAPADDPEIVVVVLNEHGGHGGTAAAPTAMAAIQAWMEIKKQDEAERAARPPQGASPPVREPRAPAPPGPVPIKPANAARPG